MQREGSTGQKLSLQRGRQLPLKLALQLYTVRDACQDSKSFIETLECVREAGYEGVELAGFYGLTGVELREQLGCLGLCAVGSHESLERLEQQPREVVRDCAQAGIRQIVCPWSPAKTAADVEHLRRVLDTVRAFADPEGISVCYHNHHHELQQAQGGRILDEIKAFCPLELDTYWAFYAGVDPCAYLRDNRERIALIHLKDGDHSGNPCAISEGVCDIQGVMRAAQETGAGWLIVENDCPTPDGISDMRRSARACQALFSQMDA